ncbi:MAG: WD40 repeat domain-containing protein, partial [Planctomycetota bacterium]
EVLRTLEHASSVLTVVFDATGERLAVAADDDGAVIWDLTDPPRRLDLGTHAGGCATVALAPSGTRLASAGADAVVVIRDIATGTVLQTLAGHDEGVIWRVAFSPDGTRLASASDDGTARIWSLVAPDETIVIDGHDDAVKWVAFDETGEHLVTTSRDTTVRTWDARTGAPERTFAGHLSKVSSAVFSADGTRILSAGNDGTLRIWEAATGAPLAVMTGHTFFTFPAVYALDGRHIFSASYDGTVRKWHASAGDELLRLPGHDRQCDDLAFSPDGSLLLTTTVRANGGDVLLWDAATSSLLARIPTPGGIRAGAFAPNGEWIAVNGGEQVTRLYDTRTGELLRVLAQSGGTLFAVAINPAGTQLATGARNGSIDLWSVPDGMLTRTIEAHERDVVSLAYSPDGRLASGGRDNAVHLWDPSTGTRLASAADHTWFVSEVAFTRDGAALLTAGLDGKVFLRDPVTLVAQGEPLAHREPIFQIGASPDGTRLVVGRNQGAPVVWDLSSREIITTLNELGIASASVAFGPAGHRAPMTERLDAHAERMRLATIVEPLVARTLANAPNALAAHAALASDTTLEPAARRVAMQLLLEHATRPPE